MCLSRCVSHNSVRLRQLRRATPLLGDLPRSYIYAARESDVLSGLRRSSKRSFGGVDDQGGDLVRMHDHSCRLHARKFGGRADSKTCRNRTRRREARFRMASSRDVAPGRLRGKTQFYQALQCKQAPDLPCGLFWKKSDKKDWSDLKPRKVPRPPLMSLGNGLSRRRDR